MKNHRTSLLCMCFAFLSLCSFAQNQATTTNEKDNNDLPDVISANITNLNTLLKVPVGNSVGIHLGNDSQFLLEGQVVSVSSKFENTTQIVVIRSTNLSGVRLTFSKTSNADGTLSYAGRILNTQNGDLYELQNQNGQFVLIKKKLNDFAND